MKLFKCLTFTYALFLVLSQIILLTFIKYDWVLVLNFSVLFVLFCVCFLTYKITLSRIPQSLYLVLIYPIGLAAMIVENRYLYWYLLSPNGSGFDIMMPAYLLGGLVWLVSTIVGAIVLKRSRRG